MVDGQTRVRDKEEGRSCEKREKEGLKKELEKR
jgi:hypothetical protein